MSGVEPQNSDVGNDRSTNCATTTTTRVVVFCYANKKLQDYLTRTWKGKKRVNFR